MGKSLSRLKKQRNFPILSLPDELIINIFAYIINLPSKMELERVCKRFRYLSMKSASWAGLHRLDMMLGCGSAWIIPSARTFTEFTSFKTECTNHPELNGVCVSVGKWANAIKLLLQRTQIHKLSLHVGDQWDCPSEIVPELMDVFQLSKDKLIIDSIELHVGVNALVKAFLLPFLLEISAPFLKNLAIVNHCRDHQHMSFHLIQKCQQLSSFFYSSYPYRPRNIPNNFVKIFHKKPLVTLSNCMNLQANQLIDIVNNVSGSGIKVLRLYDFQLDPGNTFQLDFVDKLTLKARDSLKYLFLSAKIDDAIDMNSLINWIPSVADDQMVRLIFATVSANSPDEFLQKIANIFDAPSSHVHEIIIERMDCQNNMVYFMDKLDTFCQDFDVTLRFSAGSWPWANLSKRNVTIRIVTLFRT